MGAGIVLALLVALLINAPGLTGRLLYAPELARAERLPEAPGFARGDRVLVVSPHPDDETLCCSGHIARALEAGASVHVVWVTNGDGFEFDAIYLDRRLHPGHPLLEDLGRRRMQEARNAARILGVPQNNLTFLGYPDGGLLHLFTANYATPYTSKYTGANRVPYAGTLRPGSAYTGENLARDLEAVVSRVRPTVVLAPVPEDAHPDHQTVSYLITRLMAARGELSRVRYWIVHGGLEWPLPKGWHTSLPLILPERAHNLPWRRLELSERELDLKIRTIRSYRSQIDVLGRFMEAFARRTELITLEPLPGTALPPAH